MNNNSQSILYKNCCNRARPKGSSVENAVEGPRRYLIGGNWKCNGTTASNAELIATFNDAGPIPSNVDVAICAPYIYISQVASSLRDDIAIGAQDCAINSDMGAYTGEICASQLKDVGVTWVIVGHSERRQGFGDMTPGEPETHCATKCKVAVDAGLNVMFAIGEQKEERENGSTMAVCAKQLEPLAKLLSGDDWNKVAIGTFMIGFIFVSFFVCRRRLSTTNVRVRFSIHWSNCNFRKMDKQQPMNLVSRDNRKMDTTNVDCVYGLYLRFELDFLLFVGGPPV